MLVMPGTRPSKIKNTTSGKGSFSKIEKVRGRPRKPQVRFIKVEGTSKPALPKPERFAVTVLLCFFPTAGFVLGWSPGWLVACLLAWLAASPASPA